MVKPELGTKRVCVACGTKFYDLTRTLAANSVYIASAVIATYGEQAVDTFYVKDMFGLKLHTEERRAILDKRLRDAIEQGAARAKA